MKTLKTLSLLSLSFLTVYGRELNIESVNSDVCPAETKQPWSYKGDNGPPYWGLKYKDCYGTEQSPISITSTDVVEDKNLPKLALNGYDQLITQARMENNGHTIQVTPEDGVSRNISVNGDTYSLQQFHFHWGDVYYKGTEHNIDDIQYAMEMHFVHVNGNGQIAVVGIFFQEQDYDNEDLRNLVYQLPNVQYKGDNSSILSGINLNKLFPENPITYYRYQGSLTTPPCSEGVTWSVVPYPMGVGRPQINEFRKLYSVKEEEVEESCKLFNNNRPLQPISNRQVFLSQ